MIIGLDFDGVLAREMTWPKWLPLFLIRWLLVFAPELSDLEIAQRLSQYHQLVIVTSRPVECVWVTRLWLWLHRVKFTSLYCVGLKGDKVPILLKEQVEVFFDDKPRYIEAANQKGFTSHLFQSWNQIDKTITLLTLSQSRAQTGKGETQ